LFLLFFTFSPAYFILLASIFLFESSTLTRNFIFSKQKHSGKPTPKELFRDYLKIMLPLVLSLLAASPLISFFRMFHIGEEMARANALAANTDSLHMYLDNLSIIWRYIASFDFAYLAIALKAGILGCFALKMFDKRPHTFDVSKMTFSNFLTVLFIVYFFAIAKIPNLLFTRYFIPLQPVLALIIILDSAVIYDFISHWQSAFAHYFRGTLIFLCLGFVLFNVSNNWQYIEGHAYELTHQYKGPLDYVIPFIKEKYVTTDNLIIATNYEETSFMYYLDAKVIVGYIGNNLDNDSRATPDIIFFRKKVSSKFADVFFDFLRRGRYLKILFPAMDLPPNNFPELNLAPPVMHRFLTMEANSEELQVEIYLRM
jgi:hypothetical protein